MANAIINRSSVMGLSLLMSEYGRRAQVSSRHNFQDICKIVYAEEDDFDVERDDVLPMWGTMWSFGDNVDDWWLEKNGGLQAMSNCGFRIYESEEFGYFFGIDGAGYDFYESHWEPLYKARGLQWHDPMAEEERQMLHKGYTKRSLGNKWVWCDKNGAAVKEVGFSVQNQR